jgi:hypothetical protein
MNQEMLLQAAEGVLGMVIFLLASLIGAIWLAARDDER